jgi:hypothetical protein
MAWHSEVRGICTIRSIVNGHGSRRNMNGLGVRGVDKLLVCTVKDDFTKIPLN